MLQFFGKEVKEKSFMSVDFMLVLKGKSAGSNNERNFIHNHLSFKVMYHKDPETNSSRIVGFEVTANSPVTSNGVQLGHIPSHER